MGDSTSQILLFVLAAALGGGVIGWLFRGSRIQTGVGKLIAEWQSKVASLTRQKDRLETDAKTLRSSLEAQQAVVRQHEGEISQKRTDLESAHEKAKLMAKDLFNLRAEREGFKKKMATFQHALQAVKQQSAEMQQEFIKSGDVYKRELAKAFEKRKALELKIENARSEHESFSNLLQASRSEQESVNKMLDSARNRLANLDQLEQKVIELEAENAQLNHDAIVVKQEKDALRRDVAELDELKVQNKELAHCLESMENSRKQYENDAKRYREHADQHEQHSETLALRLDEVEKNFAEIEKQQSKALKEARKATIERPSANTALSPRSQNNKPDSDSPDDLKDIVGIGKVFEHTLHELGVFTFEQIANFDVADIARVNAELKEFKGRMEQDDWIGQAKELHFKKYGSA